MKAPDVIYVEFSEDVNLFGEEIQHYPLEKKTRYAKNLKR